MMERETEPMIEWPFRLYRELQGFQVYVGPWSARFSWERSGYFANGSHWFSGWHRWLGDDRG